MRKLGAGAVRVRVPATSANLGPGYDALGLALALHDEVTARVVPAGLHITARGESAELVPRDESHLIVRAMRTTFARLDASVPGLALDCVNRIPHGRGLGSSAGAICAGILLARGLVADGADRLDDPAVLALAAQIEGHPDNVAACLFGGLTIAWTDSTDGRAVSVGRPERNGDPPGTAHAVRVEPRPELRPVVFIPPFESSTDEARGLLPTSVPHADAAFNAARSALLVAALTGDLGVLLAATADRLHQPYRAAAMPESSSLVAALRQEGIAAVISGAGPSVLALTASGRQCDRSVARTPAGWSGQALALDRTGARLVPVAS